MASHSAASLAIRYLDGPATGAGPGDAPVNSPVDPTDPSGLSGGDIPTSQLLAALSTALDLTEGQLPGHSVRTCYLASRLALRLGLSDHDRANLYYAALLKDAGCSTNAAAISQIFGGDDIALKASQADAGPLAGRICRVHDPEPALDRAAAGQAGQARPDRPGRPA